MKRVLLSAGFIAAFFLGAVVCSEAATLPPEGASPGAQASRFESEVKIKLASTQRKPFKASEVTVEEQKAEVLEGPAFLLQSIDVEGSTIFKPEDLRPAYVACLGQKVSFNDLSTIVEDIKSLYKKRGYLTTIVYLPVQDIVNGKVRIVIAEGKMGELIIEGNHWFSAKMLRRYNHIKKNEILNVNKLEKDLLRLSENGDLEIKAVMNPGKDPQTTDIVWQVKDKFPYHVGTGVDNQGSRLTGKYRSSISFRSTNLTGLNDSFYTNTLLSAGSAGQSLTYLLPVTTRGTKLGFNFIYMSSKLQKEFRQYDIEGFTQIYSPYVSQELYLSEMTQVNATTGIDIKSITRRVLQNYVNNDQIRTPYLGFNFNHVDLFFGAGQTSFAPKFEFSTSDFLGASSRGHPSASRAGSGGAFFKYEQTFQRFQRMFWNSYLLARSQMQLASHTLPSSEMFQLGGFYSVRGYPEGDYVADNGFSFNFDWFFRLPFPASWKLPFAKAPLNRQLEPMIFMDFGYGKLKKLQGGERKDKFLLGAGAGLKFRFNDRVTLYAEWAKNMGAAPQSGSGASTFYLYSQIET